MVDERSHFGVIFLSSRRSPQGKRHAGSVIEALEALLTAHPQEDAMLDREWWP